jgi:predicted nucleic-acid-binding Zn-ribbon protein
LKKTRQCPKCSSLRVGYLAEQPDAEKVLDAGDSLGPFTPEIDASSRAVGYSANTIDTGFWDHGHIRLLIGKLEAYLCADCGYHETYVKDPDSVAWEKLRGFAWLNPETDGSGPYR